MAKHFKIFIYLHFFTVFLFAQYENIQFDRIKNYEKLSNEFTTEILQDSKGFMWFGTFNGLNKYDGYEFITYYYDPDNLNSLSNNAINSLYEDKQGNLWIGTGGGGLNKFNPNTEKFTRFLNDRKNPKSIGDNYLLSNVIYEDKKGNVWISTKKGLSKIVYTESEADSVKITFENYNITSTNLDDTKKYIITSIYSNDSGFWVGTGDGSLHKLDDKTGKISTLVSWKYLKELWNLIPDNYLKNSTIFIDRNPFDEKHILTVGTNFGIYKYDTKKNIVINSFKDFMGKLKNLKKWSLKEIFIEKNGTVWITSRRGCYIINPESKSIFHYTWSISNPDGLSWKYIYKVYEDNEGIIWLGFGGRKGIQKFNKLNQQFQKISVQYDSVLFSIWSVLEDIEKKDKIIWFGTLNYGLIKYDCIRKKVKQVTPDMKNPITAICQSPINTNILWIGTWNGLYRFDKKAEKISRPIFRKNSSDSNPLPFYDNIPENTNITSLYFDTQNKLWIGSNAALKQYDTKSNYLKIFKNDPGDSNTISSNNILFITGAQIENKDLLLIGTTGGLNIFNPDKEVFNSYQHNSSDTLSLISNSINYVHEDEKGHFWIGTDKGLNKFDITAGTFNRIIDREKKLATDITSIFSDNSGYLWINSSTGFLRFNPGTKKVQVYDEHFNPYSYCRNQNRLIYGNRNIITIFNPDSIKNNPHIPPVYLTDFQVFNKSIKAGSSDQSVLQKSISETKEIILSYDQSVFSFKFTALDYSDPEENKYAYKMEGVDPQWVYTDASRRFATYTNLDPGEYTFKVKGSNNDGIWNEEGTSVNVIILPPWWKTNWAYAGYIILFGFILFGTWRIQLNRLKMKQQMEMEHFESEKLREVDKLKSHFFAHISHEFRTPLTLIKGPVKQIMDGTFTGNLKEQCKMILRNSDRLLGLINQILDLSKLESGEIKLEVQETDIIKYLKGLVLSFSSLAERKKITLKFKTEESSIIGYIDSDKMEKIFTNLLSNAFKFTPEGGEVVVKIKIPLPSDSPPPGGGSSTLDRWEENWSPLGKGDLGGCLELAITNTGPGIPADQLDKIFDRFYQADNHYKKDSDGTGIGLALTKELVEVCRGEISVESTKIKQSPDSPFVNGDFKTAFTVVLPVAKEFFKEDKIVETTPLSPPLVRGNSWGVEEINQKISDTEGSESVSISNKSAPLLLIVEDNPDVTSYICSFMENDYRIITAENGKIGLKKTIDKYPDLIISDVMMPEMDGFELCQKIKSDERISHIPVILLTAKADLDSKIEGLEFGADDYVTKPFEAKELQIRSKNLIEQRRKLREKFSAIIDLQPSDIAASSMDEQLLQRLISVFEDHIEEPEFSIEHLAREIGMSRRHLNRKILAITNLSPSDFIRTLRLQRAALLLSSASGTVSEIAYKVGFSSLSYFSKTFRKHFGKLPSDFSRKR